MFFHIGLYLLRSSFLIIRVLSSLCLKNSIIFTFTLVNSNHIRQFIDFSLQHLFILQQRLCNFLILLLYICSPFQKNASTQNAREFIITFTSTMTIFEKAKCTRQSSHTQCSYCRSTGWSHKFALHRHNHTRNFILFKNIGSCRHGNGQNAVLAANCALPLTHFNSKNLFQP